MSLCLSVQVITEEKESQDSVDGFTVHIIAARTAQAMADNGQCHFDIAGYKVMIQDWHLGTVYGYGEVRGLAIVYASVAQWIRASGYPYWNGRDLY